MGAEEGRGAGELRSRGAEELRGRGAEELGSGGAEERRSRGDFNLAPLHPCTSAQRGWEAKYSLKEGIARTYPWIEAQVRNHRLH